MTPKQLAHRLQNHRPALKRLGVACIFLLGSRALGIERPNSDYDFGILLNKLPPKGPKRRKSYDALYEILGSTVNELRNMDIIFLQDSPLELRFHTARYGIVIFETNSKIRGRFLENTIREFADFEPYRRVFENAILERIG